MRGYKLVHTHVYIHTYVCLCISDNISSSHSNNDRVIDGSNNQQAAATVATTGLAQCLRVCALKLFALYIPKCWIVSHIGLPLSLIKLCTETGSRS